MKIHTLGAVICLSLLTPTLFGQTPTTISEEARKHFVMGTTLFKDAKTADDFSQVEREFKQAADLAPQWPEARYDLALAEEAAGDYSGAMVDLKRYQQFTLSDTEARTVQDKIYTLEAKAGAAIRRQAELAATARNDAAARQLAEQERFLTSIAGHWTTTPTAGYAMTLDIQGRADQNVAIEVQFLFRGQASEVYRDDAVFNITRSSGRLRFKINRGNEQVTMLDLGPDSSGQLSGSYIRTNTKETYHQAEPVSFGR